MIKKEKMGGIFSGPASPTISFLTGDENERTVSPASKIVDNDNEMKTLLNHYRKVVGSDDPLFIRNDWLLPPDTTIARLIEMEPNVKNLQVEYMTPKAYLEKMIAKIGNMTIKIVSSDKKEGCIDIHVLDPSLAQKSLCTPLDNKKLREVIQKLFTMIKELLDNYVKLRQFYGGLKFEGPFVSINIIMLAFLMRCESALKILYAKYMTAATASNNVQILGTLSEMKNIGISLKKQAQQSQFRSTIGASNSNMSRLLNNQGVIDFFDKLFSSSGGQWQKRKQQALSQQRIKSLSQVLAAAPSSNSNVSTMISSNQRLRPLSSVPVPI